MMKIMTSRVSKLIPLIGALVAAAGLKILLLVYDVVPFNSDEAVVGLMARHIINGKIPAFFYGQSYMGSLDAILVAGSFLLFGEKVSSIRLVQVVLYLLYLISLWILTRRLINNPRIANIAVWIAAIPTVLVTTYTTATLGGYGEILFLGNLILLIGYQVLWGDWQFNRMAWIALGLVGGLSFWTLGIAGVYLMPIALIGLWKFRSKNLQYYLLTTAFFFIGSSPWWISNFQTQGAAMQVLTGSSELTIAITTPLDRLIGIIFLGIPTLFGFRFPWSPGFSPILVLFIALILYLGVILFTIFALRRHTKQLDKGVRLLFLLFVSIFLLVFIGTHFGLDATGRYFLPLYLPLVLVTSMFVNAAWDRRKIFGWGIILMILFINGYETYRAAISSDKITTQFDPITRFDNQYDDKLINFLYEYDEMLGYSNYWVSYRLAFLSKEELIFSPLLPYKADRGYTPFDNRYPLYDQLVNEAQKASYITTKHTELDSILREQLLIMGVEFSESQIGEYHIFYNLSRLVRPNEIDGLWKSQ